MRNLIRNPLTWMVVAEVVVVTALIVLAWSAIAAAASRPALAAPAVSDTTGSADTTSPLPDLPTLVSPSSPGPLPGLNVDPRFWLNRLQGLNQDQVYFEQLEWRIVSAGTEAAQRYLETVVLPSVQRAERT